MEAKQIELLGDELLQALRGAQVVDPLLGRNTGMTIDDAYRISLHMLRRREAEGEKVIGKKIGATSKAVQDMLQVHEPDFGFLMDSMQMQDGAEVSLSAAGLIQPRAEGEIAFMLRSDLMGPGITREQVLAATEWVAPCFEIVDSRVRDWKIAIQDTVADNASCGVFVVSGHRTAPGALDLAAVPMRMWKNTELAGTGLGSAVQGHPAQAVAWLANTLGRLGMPLKSGELILSGSLSGLVPVSAGDRFTLEIKGLGGCSIAFTD